jgi:hypothetical protein
MLSLSRIDELRLGLAASRMSSLVCFRDERSPEAGRYSA